MGYDAQLYPLQNVINSGIYLMDLSVNINWDNLMRHIVPYTIKSPTIVINIFENQERIDGLLGK